MVFLLLVLLTVEANVLGVDLGSSMIKVSMIKPGKKLVIVENEQSKRATPTVFAVNEQGRLFGAKAENELIKHPERSINIIKQFIGKAYTDSSIPKYLSENYNILSTDLSAFGGISYKVYNHTFEAEEIMGMVFGHIKEISDKFAKTSIKDCTVAVPSSFTRSEKKNLMAAVQLSGLNLLGLIHENTAAALYFALDRMDLDTDHVIVIYNIGANYIQVSVVDYWGFMNDGKLESHVDVLGHEYLEGFAGNSWDYEMAEFVLNSNKETFSDEVRGNKKAMARLLKEINSAKKILSANKSANIKIENFFNGIDLNFEFQRETLHGIIEARTNEITQPLSKLLTRLAMSVNDIQSFELIGGVSKVPKVQEILEFTTGAKFSSHMDPNESVAHGAALNAAKESVTVTVKPIHLSDVYTCSTFLLSSSEKIFLFGPGHKLGSKKTIEINIEEGEIIRLENQCGEHLNEFTEYLIEKTGLITLLFILDRNGLSFLAKASADNENALFKQREVDIPSLPIDSQIQTMIEKIITYKNIEIELAKLGEARNSIETITYYLKEKLEDETFMHITTAEEREKYLGHIDELQQWIDSDLFAKSNLAECSEKITTIKELFSEALEREQEFSVRDYMIGEARSYFKKLGEFMLTVTESATWIPKEEVNSAWTILNDAEKWFEAKVSEQSELEPWQPPILTSKDFDEKFAYVKKHLEKLAYSKPKGGPDGAK